MRLNVWHMHCWHNSWASLYYLIPKHVCCGSDEEGQIAKLWTSARKIQENNHACAHTQIHREPWNITQDHTQKCTWTVSAHLTPPSQYHYSSVLDKKTYTYTPTRQPIESPISSSPSRLPLSSKGWWSVERLRAHIIIYIPECYRPSWFTKQLKFLEKRLTLFVCEQQLREDDLCRQDSLLRRS